MIFGVIFDVRQDNRSLYIRLSQPFYAKEPNKTNKLSREPVFI